MLRGPGLAVHPQPHRGDRKDRGVGNVGLVNGMMGECHPVPDRIVGLEGTGSHKQSPVGAAFPMRPEEQDDLRIHARDGWEWMASWAQYWFDTQQKARRPHLFYGGDTRVVSPLVYFICHHVNKVLELPVRLWHVLENSGWQREWDYLEEHDVGTLVDGLERESVEADSVNLQNEWTSTSAEVTVWVNFDLLWDRTLEAQARRDRVVHQERECKKKSRESDADHARRRRRREKEHQEAERQVTAENASAWGSRRQAPLEERTPPATVPHRAKSSSSVSSPDSNPTVTDLDETGLVDPISDLRTHFVPDAEATPAPTAEEDPAGDEDRHAIEEMEAEYEGQDVSRDERQRGEYGGPQSYHIILSPSQGCRDKATQLAGTVTDADISPTMEAQLLGGLLHGESSPTKGSSPTETGTSQLNI